MERLHALVDAPVLLAEHLLPELHESTPRLDDRTWLHTQLTARDWDVKRTAYELGVGRTTLYRLIRRHGLARPRPSPA
jgi:transcriptional regulator of acetoin/glycerol metabolism